MEYNLVNKKQQISIIQIENEEDTTNVLPFSVFIDLTKEYTIKLKYTDINNLDGEVLIRSSELGKKTFFETFIDLFLDVNKSESESESEIKEKNVFGLTDNHEVSIVVNKNPKIDKINESTSGDEPIDFFCENDGIFDYKSNLQFKYFELTNDSTYVMYYYIKPKTLQDYENLNFNIELEIEGSEKYNTETIYLNSERLVPSYINKPEPLSLFISDTNCIEQKLLYLLSDTEEPTYELHSVSDTDNLDFTDLFQYLEEIHFVEYIEDGDDIFKKQTILKEEIYVDYANLNGDDRIVRLNEKIEKLQHIQNKLVTPGTYLKFKFETDGLIDYINKNRANEKKQAVEQILEFHISLQEIIILYPPFTVPQILPPVHDIPFFPLITNSIHSMGPPIESGNIPLWMDYVNHMGPPNAVDKFPKWKDKLNHMGAPNASMLKQHMGPPTLSLFTPQNTVYDINVVEIPMYPSYYDEHNNMGVPDDDSNYPPVRLPLFRPMWYDNVNNMGPPITGVPLWTDESNHMGPPNASFPEWNDINNHMGPPTACLFTPQVTQHNINVVEIPMYPDDNTGPPIKSIPMWSDINNHMGPPNSVGKNPLWTDESNHMGPPNYIDKLPLWTDESNHMGPPLYAIPPQYNSDNRHIVDIPFQYPPFKDALHNSGPPIGRHRTWTDESNHMGPPNASIPGWSDINNHMGPPNSVGKNPLWTDESNHMGPPNASIPGWSDINNNMGPPNSVGKNPLWTDESNHMGPPNYIDKLPLWTDESNHMGPPNASIPSYYNNLNHIGPPKGVIFPHHFDKYNNMGPPIYIGGKLPLWTDYANHMGPPSASIPPHYDITKVKFDFQFDLNFIGDTGREYTVINHEVISMTVMENIETNKSSLLSDYDIPNVGDQMFDGHFLIDLYNEVNTFISKYNKNKFFRVYFLSNRSYAYFQNDKNQSNDNEEEYRIVSKQSFKRGENTFLNLKGTSPIHTERTVFYIVYKNEIPKIIDNVYSFHDLENNLYTVINHLNESMSLREIMLKTGSSPLFDEDIPKKNATLFKNIQLREIANAIEKYIPNLRYRLYFLSYNEMSYLENIDGMERDSNVMIHYYIDNVFSVLPDFNEINELNEFHNGREVFWLFEKGINIVPILDGVGPPIYAFPQYTNEGDNMGPPFLPYPLHMDDVNNMGPPIYSIPPQKDYIHNMGPPIYSIPPQITNYSKHIVEIPMYPNILDRGNTMGPPVTTYPLIYDDFNHMGPPNMVDKVPLWLDYMNHMGPPVTSNPVLPMYTKEHNVGPPFSSLPGYFNEINNFGPPSASYPPVEVPPFIPPIMLPVMYPPTGKPGVLLEFEPLLPGSLDGDDLGLQEFDANKVNDGSQSERFNLEDHISFINKENNEIGFKYYIPSIVVQGKTYKVFYLSSMKVNTIYQYGINDDPINNSSENGIEIYDIALFSHDRNINLSLNSETIYDRSTSLQLYDESTYLNGGEEYITKFVDTGNKSTELTFDILFELQTVKKEDILNYGYNATDKSVFYILFKVVNNDYNLIPGLFITKSILEPGHSLINTPINNTDDYNGLSFINKNINLSIKIDMLTDNEYNEQETNLKLKDNRNSLLKHGAFVKVTITPENIHPLYRRSSISSNQIDTDNLFYQHVHIENIKLKRNIGYRQLSDKFNDYKNISIADKKFELGESKSFILKGLYFNSKYQIQVGKIRNNIFGDEFINQTSNEFTTQSGPIYDAKFIYDDDIKSLKWTYYHHPITGVTTGTNIDDIQYFLKFSYVIKDTERNVNINVEIHINYIIPITLQETGKYEEGTWHDTTEYSDTSLFEYSYSNEFTNYNLPKYALSHNRIYELEIRDFKQVYENEYKIRQVSYKTDETILINVECISGVNGYNDVNSKTNDTSGNVLTDGDHYVNIIFPKYVKNGTEATHYIVYEHGHLLEVYSEDKIQYNHDEQKYNLIMSKVYSYDNNNHKFIGKNKLIEKSNYYFQVAAVIINTVTKTITFTSPASDVIVVRTQSNPPYPKPELIRGRTDGLLTQNLYSVSGQNYIELKWEKPNNYKNNNVLKNLNIEYEIYVIPYNTENTDTGLKNEYENIEPTNEMWLEIMHDTYINNVLYTDTTTKNLIQVFNRKQIATVTGGSYTLQKIPGENYDLLDNAIYMFMVVPINPSIDGENIDIDRDINNNLYVPVYSKTKPPKINYISSLDIYPDFNTIGVTIQLNGSMEDKGSSDSQIYYTLSYKYYDDTKNHNDNEHIPYKNVIDIYPSSPNKTYLEQSETDNNVLDKLTSNIFTISELAPGSKYMIMATVYTNMQETHKDDNNFVNSGQTTNITTKMNTILSNDKHNVTPLYAFKHTYNALTYKYVIHKYSTNVKEHNEDYVIRSWPKVPIEFMVHWGLYEEITSPEDNLLVFNPSQSDNLFKSGDILTLFSSRNNHCQYILEITDDNLNLNNEMFISREIVNNTGFNNGAELYPILLRTNNDIDNTYSMEPLYIYDYVFDKENVNKNDKINPYPRNQLYYKDIKFKFVPKKLRIYKYTNKKDEIDVDPFTDYIYNIDGTEQDKDKYKFTIVYDFDGITEPVYSHRIDTKFTETNLSSNINT